MESKDDSGYQSIKVQGSVFTIDRKYRFLRAIGHGAYGVVISVQDENERKFAIKKVNNMFQAVDESKRILRELRLMRLMKHENIISLVDMMKPESITDFEHIYLVMELMETDLHRIIHSKQHLSIEHVQFFSFQIISGIAHLHKHHIIHRDLKPSNILVNSNCDIKICDLGLSRFVAEEREDGLTRKERTSKRKRKKKRGREEEEEEEEGEEMHTYHDVEDNDDDDEEVRRAESYRFNKPDLTEYVVTRWYRSPEVMLSCQQYSFPVDVWSVGCIMGELMLRRIMFRGEHYMHQLSLICSVLGKPHEDELSFITSSKALKFMRDREDKPKSSATDLFRSTVGVESEDLMLLMDRLLEFDPRRRITIMEAKESPFFQELNDYEREEEEEAKRGKEPENEEENMKRSFSFEYNPSLTSQDIKELMYEEMRFYHPELPLRLQQEDEEDPIIETKEEMAALYPWHNPNQPHQPPQHHTKTSEHTYSDSYTHETKN